VANYNELKEDSRREEVEKEMKTQERTAKKKDVRDGGKKEQLDEDSSGGEDFLSLLLYAEMNVAANSGDWVLGTVTLAAMGSAWRWPWQGSW
jgi:hypothetical protein